MPVYEYECPSCNKVFSVTRKIVSEDIKSARCECGETAKLIISKSTFKLNGSRWYKDGY